MTMKLYHWNNMSSLRQWHNGEHGNLVVMADSLPHARELAWARLLSSSDVDYRGDIAVDLAQEPAVYENPAALEFRGGA